MELISDSVDAFNETLSKSRSEDVIDVIEDECDLKRLSELNDAARK